ncbi:uncharacterized protein PRCAT00001331001 [Priceomyces carsonii]|uniref:uncharacterized protein n=1 Tax=Priceomyces carsonii TaxID=28549 RepID=UPI002ED94BD9|nr:unnamed protein product [Priceomyces carsonii]
MGVYIPPSSDSDGSEKGDSGGGNGDGSGRGSSITIPNPSSFIPSNPSIGLKLWGPLVPASDNTPALYLLTGIQIGIGLLGFHKARWLRRSNLLRLNIPNSASRKITKYACAVGGGYLVFLSGLEISRLSLPYDPWYEEARYYRKLAIKNGDKPNWWFGAYNYYKPMNFQEWSNKVELWIKNASNIADYEAQEDSPDIFSKYGSKSSPVLESLAKKGRYTEIYQSLHDTNVERLEELLSSDLKNVNELNKGERIDQILEGTSNVKYNESYTKPHILLGTHKIDTDEEFEMVWLNFEPWDELKLETDYDIKFIPRCRWPNDSDDSTDLALLNNVIEKKNKEKGDEIIEANDEHS